MERTPPQKRVRWSAASRIVPSRFPPIGVYDRIADPADLDALYAIEALTDPRLREELGELASVPKERRISGSGATPVMAAFTHRNPDGSRFSDGRWGVFYAAHRIGTAIEETIYHRQRFLRATAEPPIDLEMRCYRCTIDGRLHDIRGGWPDLHRTDDYAPSQALARTLREAGSNGLAYDSVRDPGGTCVALFYPDLVTRCVQAEHLIYRWNGERIAAVLEVGKVVLRN